MERSKSMLWEVGTVLSNTTCKEGACKVQSLQSLQSPMLKTNDDVSWWLDFYPFGDSENIDRLVFCLNRNNTDKEVEVNFEIHFCFYSTPVRQYTLQHVFENGEDSHKWVVDDVKNLAQIKIFIPLSTLCLIGYLTIHQREEILSNLEIDKKYETNIIVNV